MQSRRIASALNNVSDDDDQDNNLSSSFHSSSSNHQHDSASALQQFLDRIPITSIPGIKDSLVLELKAGDTIKDAIHLLYEKDTFGAAIVDVLDTDDTASIKFSDRYIGFVHFATMLLWCLEEYEKMRENAADNHLKDIENHGFFSILDQIPQIGETKVGELAKSFIWEPFFPVCLDDTILHALLLLSKHRLHVLPVIQQPHSGLIGFVTQNSLLQQLLQSSELEWFDNIADKNLSQFRFEGQEHPSIVFGDQPVVDALKLLWQNQTCAVAVVNRQTKKLLGNVRNNDIYNLINNDHLLRNRTILTVEEFIHTEVPKRDSLTTRMDSPVSNKENDTLKQVTENMTQTNSSFSFLINDREQVTGLITLRDIILQFSPPCVNSSIDGGGFFEFALEQSGCQVKNGTIMRKH